MGYLEIATLFTDFESAVKELEKRGITEPTAYAKIGVSRQNWYNYKIAGKIPLEKAKLLAKMVDELSTFNNFEEINNTTESRSVRIKAIRDQSASAGVGFDIESIHSIEYDYMDIDKSYLRGVRDYSKVRAISVDGKSMLPTIMPNDWAIYEENIGQYRGDGLYIVNFGGMLMVKRIQFNPEVGKYDIISDNPQFKSYSVMLNDDDQTTFMVIGKVITTIQQ